MDDDKKQHIREINKLVQKWGNTLSDPPISAITSAKEALEFYISGYAWPYELEKLEEDLKILKLWLEEMQ